MSLTDRLTWLDQRATAKKGAALPSDDKSETFVAQVPPPPLLHIHACPDMRPFASIQTLSSVWVWERYCTGEALACCILHSHLPLHIEGNDGVARFYFVSC